MTNFRYAKYDSVGTQVDDPSFVPQGAGYTVDANGNINALVGSSGQSVSFPFIIGRKYSGNFFTCNNVAQSVNAQLDSLVIPANTVGANSMLRVTAQWALTNGNAIDVLARIGLTSGTFATATNILNNQGFGGTQRVYTMQAIIVNKGVQNSQTGSPPQFPLPGNAGANVELTSAIDFSQSVTIYFGGTNTNSFASVADKVTFLWYLVEVIA
jgi:hypothetical protein